MRRVESGEVKADRSNGETRRRLLEAACRVFARYGFQSTPVKRIVHEAGIAKPTLYYYFGDKNELYREVVLDCFNHLCQRLREANLQGPSQLHRAECLIRHFANLVTEMPDRLVVLFNAWYAPPRSADRVRGLDELRFKLVELISSLLTPGEGEGSWRGVDPLCAAELVMGTMAQLIWHLLLHEPRSCPSNLVRGLARALTCSWNGMKMEG